jgi:hypothetical protein
MTSVNESNAYQRGKREGYAAGKEDMRDRAIKEGTTLRAWKLVIIFIIGFMLGTATNAQAQIPGTPGSTPQTAVVITVAAQVPCNPQNCPEEETENVDSIEQSWWQRMLQWVEQIL